MNSPLLYILLFVVLLLLSSAFSGAETAFFRLQARIRDYGAEAAIPPSVLAVLKRPRRLLISLLTGNTLVNISLAFIAALLTADLAQDFNLSLPLLLVVESLVVATLVLLFGEVMPKILAIRYTTAFARAAGGPVRVMVALLYPLGYVLYGVTHLVTRLLGVRPEQMFTSEEELKDLAAVGADRGTLARRETEIIHSIFEFSDTAVHEVMVPRVDILALDAKAGVEEALELVRDRQISKIPIFRDSIDYIHGILYAKDVLPYLSGAHPDVKLLRLSRPPFFVPESKGVVSLLRDFQERRTSIAIVVDEFGGTAGLVTLEDVVEEVLGEMRDPYDLADAEIVSLGTGEFLVDAAFPLDDLGDRLDCPFPDERDYDTLGGFLFDRFDEIPTVGQETTYGRWRFSVHQLDGNRIAKVHVRALAEGDGEIDAET